MTGKIKLTNNAFFTLLLEGLEAYAIKHHGKRDIAIETHAQLWGSSNKRLPFSCEVEHVSVDSSANKKRGSVTPHPLSLELKKDVAHVFGSGYAHLGSFHTHPYTLDEGIESPNEIRRNAFYDFSDGDHYCECDNPTIEVGTSKFSIALVMTIFAGKKADDRKDGAIDDSLYEFSLGNVKVWLKAQIYEHKLRSTLSENDYAAANIYRLFEMKKFSESDYERLPIPIDTQLETPFLNDLGFYLEKFGRVINNQGAADYKTAKDAEKRWLFI
jgi:hypothetical protein